MIHSKLPHVGTTIFTRMSALAAEHGAINLGQGFPGFPIDMKLAGLVEKAIRDGHNQYAPMAGALALRERIAEKMFRSYGAKWDPASEITITAGATQAIFTAITACVRPGDEVILFAPAYDCYAPAVEVNGGIPVWIQLSWPDYSIPWDSVRERLSSRTRMIIVNSPHNPTGAVLSESDLRVLEEITRGTDIVVLSDEVYEHIVFDGISHQSVSRSEELCARSLLTFSFGKTFHATGWKLGYIAGNADLMGEFRKVHQFNVFSCNSPVQMALAAYMEDASTYEGLSAFYQRKRDLFLDALRYSRFTYEPARGTYFQLLNYTGISDEKDTDLAVKWTKSPGIASIPVSAFNPGEYDQKVLRFCFAKEDALLVEAARMLSGL